uniref:Uncharacterized protein n=1 Tax=Alexandrium andersonii TaxID=327968 RepID=A0A7S2ACW6_9DINO
MKAKFPLPSPGPELAETVGSFFGMQNVGCNWEPAKSGEGLHYACIHVDLYSRWYVRMGMQNGCFRPGNVVELLLVDAPQKAIISAFRLSIDQEFVSKVT